MQKVKFDSRAFVPIATAILSLVFIGVGLNKFGFWDGQPTPAFFPTIIAVVLFATSLMCLVQELRSNQAIGHSWCRRCHRGLLGHWTDPQLPALPAAVAEGRGEDPLEGGHPDRGLHGRPHHRGVRHLDASTVPHGTICLYHVRRLDNIGKFCIPSGWLPGPILP